MNICRSSERLGSSTSNSTSNSTSTSNSNGSASGCGSPGPRRPAGQLRAAHVGLHNSRRRGSPDSWAARIPGVFSLWQSTQSACPRQNPCPAAKKSYVGADGVEPVEPGRLPDLGCARQAALQLRLWALAPERVVRNVCLYHPNSF